MSKILKRGKIVTVRFACDLCGCEFIAKARDCNIDFDSHRYAQDGDAIHGCYDADTKCPECGCACRSSEIIFEERDEEKECEQEQLLQKAKAEPVMVPEDPFKKMCPKW